MGTATFTQSDRPLAITTPLGPDAVLLTAIQGYEGLSRLFRYELELLADHLTPIIFDRLLGQRVTVTLERPHARRFFNGIVNRLSQVGQDGRFLHYRAEIVPDFWLLTRRRQCRIFQHLSVPDILRQVLQGLDVGWQIMGTFHPRDYCVQYRESDFDFASRLMEEEGIYYLFEHSDGGHRLVLGNTPLGHPDVADPSRVSFGREDSSPFNDDRVNSWQKVQELRSDKITLWDHSFELPRQQLDAERLIQDSVAVGQVNHLLKVGANGRLEIYDYPGRYAQRFDGINRNGVERPDDLGKIFEDNQRTAGIRMQEEAALGLAIHGSSNCRQFAAGHKFSLIGHGDGDGLYVLTSVQHSARQSYASGDGGGGFSYHNAFTCIPIALPFRPERKTPKPVIYGTQTATVVGPAGEEIHVDKYGRVKVQFHWDRDRGNNTDSSCWLRVAQLWAGNTYGTFFWPRVGHEVVVAFEEGDPDCPIVIGSVYNAENATHPELPKQRNQSGVSSQSTPGGSPAEFNAIGFDDTRGEELLYFRAQRDCKREVLHDDHLVVGNTQTVEIKKGRKQVIVEGNDEKEVSDGDVSTSTKGNETHTVTGKYDLAADGAAHLKGGDSELYLEPEYAMLLGPTAFLIGKGNAVLRAGAKAKVAGGDRVTIQAPLVEVQASLIILKGQAIELMAPMVTAHGVLHCTTLVAETVQGGTYTPGPGNLQ